MGRALALLLCGAALSACSSLPGLSGSQASAPTISLDSIPPGADVSFSGGGSCKTPCSLAAPGSNGTYYVNFILNGYTRQSIPVRVSTGKENWYSSETTTVEPSSVMARTRTRRAAATADQKEEETPNDPNGPAARNTLGHRYRAAPGRPTGPCPAAVAQHARLTPGSPLKRVSFIWNRSLSTCHGRACPGLSGSSRASARGAPSPPSRLGRFGASIIVMRGTSPRMTTESVAIQTE